MSAQLREILIRHWLFGVLPGKVISDLSHQFTTQKYTKKQYVFHQDDEASNLFVILDGEIFIETMDPEGKVTRISDMSRGDIFGEFALIDGKNRSASAEVHSNSIIASLNRNLFCNLLETYPSFAKALMNVLVGKLRTTNNQIESLVNMSLLQRTAQMLLQIYQNSGEEIHITQIDLAERVHATRERVNSKLKELERRGAIKTGHGKVIVIKPELLTKAVEYTNIGSEA